MKTKPILLLFAFSLVSAASAYGQGNHYRKGNPHTDKQHTDKEVRTTTAARTRTTMAISMTPRYKPGSTTWSGFFHSVH